LPGQDVLLNNQTVFSGGFLPIWGGCRRPSVHVILTKKTLLAYRDQEQFNLPMPPFSRFPSLSADALGALRLLKRIGIR
jgi:hypothetical protein